MRRVRPGNGMMRAVNKVILGDGHPVNDLDNGKDHGHDA